MDSKRDLRVRAKAVNRARVSDAITGHLEAWRPLHGRVLSYLAVSDEPNVGAVHALARCAIAVTRASEDGGLTVHNYDDGSLERHRLGFLQPKYDSPELSLDDLDVVLVPGLVFDRRGNRLGRGKGYYDELLGRIPIGVARVGVGVDELFVDELPTEPHDERVAWVVTESGVHRVGQELSEATSRFVREAVAVGIAPDIHWFGEGTKTSQDAAKAVGVTVGEIAKSILFAVDDRFVLVLCSGDRRIDENKLAEHCSAGRVMVARLRDVSRVTGYEAGGTPGVGLPKSVEVVADVGLARYRWVWSAGGTPDTVFPIAVARLVAASAARWADVSNKGKT